MPNRTFIGLIFLIVALIVASTPALLTPASEGVRTAGIKAGLLKDAEAAERAALEQAKQDGTAKPVDPYLAMRGYQLERDGDLRDVAGDTRGTWGTERLDSGARRAALPGQRLRDRNDTPPVAAEDGVLLDATGCPIFAKDADVATLMANPDTTALYATKAADADDPATCTTLLQERVDAATAGASGMLAGDRRAISSALRDDSQRMLVETYAADLFLAMFGDDVDTGEVADALRAELRDGA